MRYVAILVENFKGTDVLVFAIATLQLFQYPENEKISIFPITLSQLEMLYLQKCSTNFQNTFFGSKIRKVAILVEDFKCTDILVLAIETLQLFQYPEKVKISIFSITLSPAEMLYLQKYFGEFSKNFFA